MPLKNHSLLNRLVIYVFAFAVSLALLTSVGNYYYARHKLKSETRLTLEQLQKGQLKSLANSIWNYNQEAINIQLQSILSMPYVAGIQLQTNDNQVISFGGVDSDNPDLSLKSFDLSYNYGDKQRNLGSIDFYIDERWIRDQVSDEILVSFFFEVAGLIITCLFILVLFLVLFNRHLNRIVAYTDSLRIDRMDHPLQLQRSGKNKTIEKSPDELERIVIAINGMRRRLHDGLVSQQDAEKKVRREKKFSDTLINSLPMLFFVFDEDLRTIRYNTTFAERVGGSSSDVRNLNILARIHEEDRYKVITAIKDLFRNGNSIELEATLLAQDGEPIPYFLTGSILEEEGEKYLIGLGMDMTEKKRLERELHQAQKMEAIGTLAGGIAHDFNNILSAILGNAELASVKLENENPTAGNIDAVIRAAKRARDLVGQILTFSRKQEHETISLKPSLIVTEALQLLRSTIPSTIEIKSTLPSKGKILADPTQIHQVVMNLCTNGYHSMQHSGGILSVNVEDVDILPGEKQQTRADIPPGSYVRMEVSDTGCGMDRATREKIFEPYFTTKEKGSGTGLGLAVVHGIVQTHGGHIRVYSEPDEGTTFRLFFPCINENELPGEESVDRELPGGNECILVVDDEEAILRIITDMLEQYGYTVKPFLDSEQALSHFLGDPAAIDLVITDLTMPRLPGYELACELLEVRKDLPIILCTGFSESIRSEKVLAAGIKRYLQKPVDMDDMLNTIREVLD